MSPQKARESLTEVGEQVPAVRDLLSEEYLVQLLHTQRQVTMMICTLDWTVSAADVLFRRETSPIRGVP